MSFDWKNYVILADELRTLQCKGGTEARLRASVSRGYYGIFHLTRQRLAAEGLKFGGGTEVHQEVAQALRTSGDPARFALGREIGRLRGYRNMADYEDEIQDMAIVEGESLRIHEGILRQLGVTLGRNGK